MQVEIPKEAAPSAALRLYFLLEVNSYIKCWKAWMQNHDKLIGKLVMVQSDGYRHVGMLPDVYKDFLATGRRWREVLNRLFGYFGIHGTSMPPEKYKSLGRFSCGGAKGNDILLCEFKAYQHRLYGTIIDRHGIQTFVGLKLIEDKKTTKANQELLKRIAKEFSQYLD